MDDWADILWPPHHSSKLSNLVVTEKKKKFPFILTVNILSNEVQPSPIDQGIEDDIHDSGGTLN